MLRAVQRLDGPLPAFKARLLEVSHYFENLFHNLKKSSN
jgi:hypothetical protein